MFSFSSNIKSKFAVAAVVAAGAMAVPAMASAAPDWSSNGTPITSNQAISGAGTLSLSAGGLTVTCDVTNAGTVGAGGADLVTAFGFDLPCATNIPGCVVTAATANGLNWTSQLNYDGTIVRDQINGVSISNTFTGSTCPVPSVTATGTLNPRVVNTADGVDLTFDTTSGTLTIPGLGSATVTGIKSEALDSGAILSAS